MIQQKHRQQMLAGQATSATVAPALLGLKWMRQKSEGGGNKCEEEGRVYLKKKKSRRRKWTVHRRRLKTDGQTGVWWGVKIGVMATGDACSER